MVTYKIDLDITPGGIPKVVHVKQYQTDATLEFKLHTRRGTLDVGTWTDCSVRGTKSDGNGYSASADFTLSSSTVTVTLTEQMTAVAGRQPYEITLTDETGKMITATFYLDVQGSAFDMDTPSDSVIRELVDALDHTDDILEAFDAAQYDDTPTTGSTHAVKSGGIKSYVDGSINSYRQTVNAALSTKLDSPQTGTTGQFLRKASSGNEWVDLVTETDENLNRSGIPADARVTGNAINTIKNTLNFNKSVTPGYILTASGSGNGSVWSPVGLPTDAQTDSAVQDWLDDHPEATTTVVDESLTNEKLVKGTLGFVTPEMYGAHGDGVTDDSDALERALQSDYDVRGSKNAVYYLKRTVSNCKGNLKNVYILYDVNKSLSFVNAKDISIDNCTFEQFGTLTDPEDRGEFAIGLSFAENVRITNCKFENATSGIIFNLSSNCGVSNCVFDTAPQTATGGNGYGIVLQCCKNIDITSNTFRDIARHGVYVSYTTAFEDLPEMVDYNYWCDNVNVSDNVFVLENNIQGYNVTTFEYPLKFISTHNAVASNNQFINCIGAIWLSQGDGVGNENILLTDNVIVGCFGTRASILALSIAGDGINKNVKISSNVIKSNNPGIKMYLSENLTVSDNIYSGTSYLLFLSHEGGDIETLNDLYLSDTKICNNNCDGGLVRFVGDSSHPLGKILDCYIENNTANVDNAIFFNGLEMKFERLYITGNAINGSTSLACFNNTPASFNKIYILRNIFTGNINWSNTNSTNVYVLDNDVYGLTGSATSLLITDFYDDYIISSGTVTFTPTSGRNTYTVTFSRELRVVPTKILLTARGSAYFDTLVNGFVVQDGTITKQGFNVAYNYVGANIYDITFTYVVIGKH